MSWALPPTRLPPSTGYTAPSTSGMGDTAPHPAGAACLPLCSSRWGVRCSGPFFEGNSPLLGASPEMGSLWGERPHLPTLACCGGKGVCAREGLRSLGGRGLLGCGGVPLLLLCFNGE